MHLIGDIHGKLNPLARKMRKIEGEALCVGDIGIGFPGVGNKPSLSKRFWFIRGNHDEPEAAVAHPQYAKDYGMWRDMFVIAGARSVDVKVANRVEGRDWWRGEELTHRQCEEALDLYIKAKPEIVVSHDCPFGLHQIMKEIVVADNSYLEIYGEPAHYNQVLMMDEMLKIHRPRLWVFGHWHLGCRFEIKGTLFRCLAELEMMEVAH